MARRWASGRGGSSRPEDAPDAATAAFLRRRAELLEDDDAAVIEIGAGEADAIHLFFALGTQWLRAGMSGSRVGIDYRAIEPTARMIGLDAVPLFADLQTMEREALREFAK